MDYETAIAGLLRSRTRCQAARALAHLGERRAVAYLMAAYELGLEKSALCLLDALEALGGAAAADELFDQAPPDQRRWVIHMMELFPDDHHLPRLVQALADPEARVHAQARRSLSAQRQTPAWVALMVELLAAEDVDNRLQAVESLMARPDASVRQALRERLAMETDPRVHARLVLALK
jgi:HEAT repeat protein